MPSKPPEPGRLSSDWSDQIAESLRGDFGSKGDSLKRDIQDELADHLSTALERETRHGLSEVDAEKAVLERFGSPERIARRLWFDGMKGKIMAQRWMIAMVTLLAFASFAACGLAFWSARQTNQALQEAVAGLNERHASTESMDWVTLRFRCVDADNAEQPLACVELEVSGCLISGDVIEINGATNEEGLAEIGPLRPGRHRLKVQNCGIGKWYSNSTLTVLPGQKDETRIICPTRLDPPVAVRLLLPEKDRKAHNAVSGEVTLLRKVDARDFSSSQGGYFIVGDGRVFRMDISGGSDLIGAAVSDLALSPGPGALTYRCYNRWVFPEDAVIASGKRPNELGVIQLRDNVSTAFARAEPLQAGKVNDWVVVPESVFPSGGFGADPPPQ